MSSAIWAQPAAARSPPAANDDVAVPYHQMNSARAAAIAFVAPLFY
jgi:hypothetical protein